MAKAGSQKAKGNAFERTIAKKLSKWIYGDEYILGRDPTSGARGTVLGKGQVFVGDIIPVKQLPLEWKGQFPFVFECKTGYKALMPNLNQQNIIHKWVKKLIKERVNEQQTPILIVRFLRQKPLMIIPFTLSDVNWSICINIYCDGIGYVPFYTYMLEEVLSSNFNNFYKKMTGE